MSTMTTDTVRITIEAPLPTVVDDLADPLNHPEWATEFFIGPALPAEGDEVLVTVPRMGGEVHMRVDADVATGTIDMYLAPVGAPFGPPLPVRVVPNGTGADVLFTLARMPGMSDQQWADGLVSMQRELDNLKHRLETA